jgi:integrase
MPRSSEVQFYLKPIPKELSKSEAKKYKRLIYLQFKYNRNKLFFSFGQRVTTDSWNELKQRVRNSSQATEDGQYLLNDLLESLKKQCERSYKAELKNGIPTVATLKNHLQSFMDRNKPKANKPSLFNLIEQFIAGDIRDGKGKKKSLATIMSYKVAYNHLKAFQLITKYPLDFDTINLEFYRKYLHFLEQPASIKTSSFEYKRKEGLSINSVGNQIKTLKTFMSEGVEQKLTDNIEFKAKKFVKPSEASDSIYLTEKEILKLYRFDLSHNKRLEQVRDLFVFGCFVGLRYSDYSTVKPENIINVDGEYFIKMITQKTGERVVIPCNPIVLEIFKKYEQNPNRLPVSLSNQKFNDYIKEACKEAGFDETGRLITKPEKPLYECISSHTARRSFATNYYLSGFPTIDLMKITGHKTEISFLKYVKVSKEQSAQRLSEHIKKNWSELVLRVA